MRLQRDNNEDEGHIATCKQYTITNNITEMLIPCDEVNILNTFRVMVILRPQITQKKCKSKRLQPRF